MAKKGGKGGRRGGGRKGGQAGPMAGMGDLGSGAIKKMQKEGFSIGGMGGEIKIGGRRRGKVF